jgi:hypothetical protein
MEFPRRKNRNLPRDHTALQWLQPDSSNKLKQWFQQSAPFDAQYFTGFLYGDAVLFYALTWTPYTKK